MFTNSTIICMFKGLSTLQRSKVDNLLSIGTTKPNFILTAFMKDTTSTSTILQESTSTSNAEIQDTPPVPEVYIDTMLLHYKRFI